MNPVESERLIDVLEYALKKGRGPEPRAYSSMLPACKGCIRGHSSVKRARLDNDSIGARWLGSDFFGDGELSRYGGNVADEAKCWPCCESDYRSYGLQQVQCMARACTLRSSIRPSQWSVHGH